MNEKSVRQMCIEAFNAGVDAAMLDEGHYEPSADAPVATEPEFPEAFEAWWTKVFG